MLAQKYVRGKRTIFKKFWSFGFDFSKQKVCIYEAVELNIVIQSRPKPEKVDQEIGVLNIG